jgi:putative membrane protein
MYTRVKYSLRDMLIWTRWEILLYFIYAFSIAVLYQVIGLSWLQLPWTPIALIGTAVAFLIGFQSNAAYGRIWEARKIWGGIVNYSRSLGIMVNSMVNNEYCEIPLTEEELHREKTILIQRHIAWLTALRYAMRQNKPWEVFIRHRTNREWYTKAFIPERDENLEDQLTKLISKEEYDYVMSKTNKATTLINLQSNHLKRLKEAGVIWEFSFLELQNINVELYNLQGKSERIKNFPYPRQFATLGYDFVKAFILLLPFGVIPEFSSIGLDLLQDFPVIGKFFVWASIPFVVIVSWIFSTMQRIGTVGENPFEGSANDVPISTIARGIEIDLREMLDQPKDLIPEPYQTIHNIQM